MLINLWKIPEYPEKVVLMNEAVNSLLAEGRNINTMSVSEITNRAGIGKGTAYEYFSSKEEIIARSLEANLATQIHDLVEREAGINSFREMLEVIVEWMTDNFKKNTGFTILFKNAVDPTTISDKQRQAFHEKCPGEQIIMEMIGQILRVGEKEGVIKTRHPYFGSVAIISQVMAYSMYLVDERMHGEIPENDVKEFTVDSIIKMLA